MLLLPAPWPLAAWLAGWLRTVGLAVRLPACTACHGAALAGTRPAVPGLLGLPRDYLIGQIGAWQTGKRHAIEPDCMADISRRLGA